MTDNLTKKQRSKTMSNIRSKNTVPEITFKKQLRSNNIRYRMHPKLIGNPDFLLLETKTVIFIHGCFWHKCAKHYKEPKSNQKYWLPKIQRNVLNDAKNRMLLRKKGYKVSVIWEHELKSKKPLIIRKINY